MYSYEDRIKAVKLYIKYDQCSADTIRELGYPSRSMLVRWYKEYEETGDLHEQFIKEQKYTVEEMEKAVDHYLEHGRCLSRTVRILGYPSRITLVRWIEELAPGERKVSVKRGNVVKFSEEEKRML